MAAACATTLPLDVGEIPHDVCIVMSTRYHPVTCMLHDIRVTPCGG